MEITEESSINNQSFPQGSLISSKLSSHAVANLLEVHNFLCCFKEVIGIKEPISFQELEQELLSPNPYGVAKSSILHTFETFVHSVLLPELVSKLLGRLASMVNTKLGVKIQLDMLPINEFTWPEVVRRYIMAYLLMGGKLGSSKIDESNRSNLIHCLQSDCGIFCVLPNNVARVDLDAQLLGTTINKVFGKLKSVRNTVSMSIKGDCSDGGIPEWAKVLDPVKKLPTNVGSRIRNCVYEALKKNPPEWAKNQLEASISKEVYKCNASGPTKRAVIEVLNRSASEVQNRPLSLDVNIKSRSYALLIPKIIMKKCRSILHDVAVNYDSKKDFSTLMGNNLKFDEIKVVFESASRRPLDFPTVYLRLLYDTYCGSPQAFLEDVRELWINLKKTYANTSSLVKLVDDMSKDFNLKYENEVVPLLMKLSEYNMNGMFNADVEKELEELLESIEIPKMSLEAGICKVCDINKDDDKVLLCDTEWCNAEYHTYCLNPPIFEIPQGNWYCPACKPLADDQPKNVTRFLQFVDKSCREEANQFLDILNALEETEYWQLDAHKKIFLLKFLVDRSIDTSIIRKNICEIKTNVSKKFLGVDFLGRIYWFFPYVSSNYGILVNLFDNNKTNPIDNDGQWYLFHTDEQINKLVDYLTKIYPYQTELKDSILLRWKTVSQTVGIETDNSTKFNKLRSRNRVSTNAIMLLEAKYGSVLPTGKNVTKCYRCDCLEPVLPSRHHCVNCHQTFCTNVEFQHHKNSSCKMTFVENLTVGESSSSTQLSGDNYHLIKQMVINLLDIEAALPDEARRRSMAGPEWRSGWCAFVKSARTIRNVFEASLALETMIKTQYINNTWWWFWSSVSIAAKTSTIAGIALRVYTLDAAIKYKKNANRVDEQQLRKTNQSSEKAKKQKKSEEREEKVDRTRMT